MVGYVSEAVAKALKNWKPLADAGIIPIRATGGTTVLENIPLPSIGLHVIGDDGEGNTFLVVAFVSTSNLYCTFCCQLQTTPSLRTEEPRRSSWIFQTT